MGFWLGVSLCLRIGGGWYSYPGWTGYGYGDAGWYGNNDSYAVQSYPAYDSSYDQSNQLQQDEIDRLNDEVASLQQQRQAQSFASPSQPRATSHGETVLVFRDKHVEEVQDYAIVGQTLWIFSEQRARKIPIADLDVPATTKANEDRGIDFRLPN